MLGESFHADESRSVFNNVAFFYQENMLSPFDEEHVTTQLNLMLLEDQDIKQQIGDSKEVWLVQTTVKSF